MATKKKNSNNSAERAFAQLRQGAVEASAFLEKRNGPLTLGGLMKSIRQCDGADSTLATMAAKLGISRSHLHDVEKGARAVSPERAARWAKLLGYSREQFVQLALQAELDQAGIKLRVTVVAA